MGVVDMIPDWRDPSIFNILLLWLLEHQIDIQIDLRGTTELGYKCLAEKLGFLLVFYCALSDLPIVSDLVRVYALSMQYSSQITSPSSTDQN